MSASTELPSLQTAGPDAHVVDIESPIAPELSFGGDCGAGSESVSDIAGSFRPKKVRIMEPTLKWAFVHTEASLASIFLGKETPAERRLFRAITQKNRVNYILWTSWWVGLAIGYLCMIDWLPLQCIWFSLFMLPLPLCNAVLLSLSLIWELLRCFETYLLLVLELQLLFSAWRILNDVRHIFWLSFFPSMVMALFADAYPQKYRQRFALRFFSCFPVVLLIWNLGLYLGWYAPVKEINYDYGPFRGSVAASMLQNSMTLFGLTLKQTFYVTFKPDVFVVITSRVRTYHKDVRKLSIIQQETVAQSFHGMKSHLVRNFEVDVP